MPNSSRPCERGGSDFLGLETRIMNFELKKLDLDHASREKCDALIVLVGDAFKPGKDVLSVQLAAALKAGDLQAKSGKTLALYHVDGITGTRVVFAHCAGGSAKEVSESVAAAVLATKAPNVKKLVLCFALPAQPTAVRAALLAVAQASYAYTSTKSKPEPRAIERVVLALPEIEKFKTGFTGTCATITGIELAKEWANRPANHATPSLLANVARVLAKLPNIKCEVLGLKEVTKLAMGAFLAVAQASQEPLRFIVLRYNGAAKATPPTVLVGKGITFDSGGISIKPSAEMDEMKFDMSGAASVLGVFRTLGELRPAINVVGLIPACENLPGGAAVKPGDVITSMSGQTVEVLNTDAEGRLVLCDALTYAQRFKPAAIIDIATLTGACMIALGGVRSGMFSNDETLAGALLAAGESSSDPCWRMPLDDDYAEGLKTSFADVANVAGRMGGAITAAKFLQRFAGQAPWAHLDIAGTAWKSGTAKGATGRPVALLLQYLLTEKN